MNYTQLQFKFNDCDAEYTHGRRNVLMVSEIENAGFVWTPTIANVTNEDVPYITHTYDMGIYENADHQKIPEIYKEYTIKKMKEIGLKYVFQVYFGEIYINPYDGSKKRWNHIFARGSKERL